MIEITDEMREYFNNELWDINIDHPEWEQHTSRVMKRIIELHEANKPKREPVGYAWIIGEQIQKLADVKLNNSFVPLYTTPPTREPLSEEEIERLVPWQGDPKDPFFNRIKFARLVEQAHRIGTSHEPA